MYYILYSSSNGSSLKIISAQAVNAAEVLKWEEEQEEEERTEGDIEDKKHNTEDNDVDLEWTEKELEMQDKKQTEDERNEINNKKKKKITRRPKEEEYKVIRYYMTTVM